jgi:hypothetical protein
MMARSIDSEGASTAAVAVAVKSAGRLRARFDLVEKGLEQMFEHRSVVVAFVCVVMLSVAIAPTRLTRRYVATFCGALAVFFMNPYLANFVRHNLTGEFTGQRAMWLAPVPTAFTVVFAAFIPLAAPRAITWLRTAVATLALSVFLTLVPTRAAISRQNGVRWEWPPGEKVPTNAFKVVRALRKRLRAGDVVLAPALVSWYLPTLTQHPYPLLANTKYLSAPRREDKRRERLVRLVSKRKKSLDDKSRKALTRSVERDGLDAIVLTKRAARTKGLTRAISDLGFRRVGGAPGYLVWVGRSRR